MGYITQYKYYENDGLAPENENWGSYQYVSLYDIVNNFNLMYADNHSLVNNTPRYKMLFHAKRAIQELNYDAFKEIKVLELAVNDDLRYVLPSDYVNWVRVSMYVNGVLRPLTENIQILSSNAYLQDQTGKILFDVNGNVLRPQFSGVDHDRILGTKQSIYLDKLGGQFNGQQGYNVDGNWYFSYGLGAKYGLNTETANRNPTFTIDSKKGVINFSSSISNNLVVLEYVSDGMEAGDNSKITVNKLFEDYVYKAMEYEIMRSRLNTQEYVIKRLKNDRRALLANARIRISNMKPGRLLMNMRGQDKWIK